MTTQTMSKQSMFALPVPATLGSLDAYISTVNRFPILSPEEESSLARRWHDDEDLEAARGLVVSHLRLVVAIARGYLGYGLPHGDLIQEGNIGLMKAVKRFDPDRGVRLVSFAIHWIRAEIHEFVLRNWRLVRVATTKAQRKLFFNLRSMKTGAQTLSPGGREAHRHGAQRETRRSRGDGDPDDRGRSRARTDWRRARSPSGRSTISPTRRTSRRGSSRTPSFRRCVRRASPRRSRASIRAAGGSSRRVGWWRRTRPPCMISPPNSTSRPSAFVRSKRRRSPR